MTVIFVYALLACLFYWVTSSGWGMIWHWYTKRTAAMEAVTSLLPYPKNAKRHSHYLVSASIHHLTTNRCHIDGYASYKLVRTYWLIYQVILSCAAVVSILSVVETSKVKVVSYRMIMALVRNRASTVKLTATSSDHEHGLLLSTTANARCCNERQLEPRWRSQRKR